MNVRRGAPWGERVAASQDVVRAASDAEAAAVASAGKPVRLGGGDLLATLGGSADGLNRYRIDMLRVLADDRHLLAVAHVVARGRSWWRGPVVAALNAEYVGAWDVAPRAHPGDGRFDVMEVDATMPVRSRWQAWRRLPTGTHVPHPQMHLRQAASVTWTFDRRRRLWVDGVRRGTVRSLVVSVEPGLATVHT
ncbi:MAG: hypothetical protein ACR2HQ_12350 [Ilumatobacteraceae bacterium]